MNTVEIVVKSLLLNYFFIGIKSASHHSARSPGNISSSAGTSTTNKKTSAGKDRNSDDKVISKQKLFLPSSSSVSGMQSVIQN